MMKVPRQRRKRPWSDKVIGTTLNQRFTLDKELGRGGMGAVYRATDQVLQRTVAIKILKERTGDEVGRKIRLEAQILARLLHEHIVRLYDFGEADGTYFFVMEEVDGSSFSRRWKQIPLAERLMVIAETADALNYAHHQGVIHRDVKPANVLLTSADTAKLSDFGLSLIADDAQVDGVIKGTPHYMSPEQAKGRRLDYRTDLYALGVMAYECATGLPPFQGPSMAVIASHVNAVPDTPRSRNQAISPALEALILRLLAKDPDARPGSGAEVAASLRDLIATDPTLRDPAHAGATGDPSAAPSLTPPTIRRVDLTVVPQSSTGSSATGPGSGSGAGTGMVAARLPSPSPELVVRSRPTIAVGLDRARASAMIGEVEANPIELTADQRYFSGHYLAYLLGGSRRQGFFRRRPLDPLNADRARLMLAMTWLMIRGPGDDNLARAADLLESRHDVRPALSPITVTKYLGVRDTPAKRKSFRVARKRLREASAYAATHMTDDKGVLNPGLMPQVLDDLRKVAPARVEVDDQLVGRWNRVAEVWRGRPDFRQAVLGYATTSAGRDPASLELWPEVVYPLIERARWQRQLRSNTEAIWDNVTAVLRLPDAGVQLDRVIRKVVPPQVVEKLDLSLAVFEEDPVLDADLVVEAEAEPAPRGVRIGASSLQEIVLDQSPDRGFVRLVVPDPFRFTMGDLRELWQEAVNALRTPGARGVHRNVPVGPYRLAVIPSIRGKSAGQIAIQGMHNKQIEMLIPSIRLASSAGKPIMAAWSYEDDSLVVAYVDYRNDEKYILWHAPTSQQTNFDAATTLNSTLLQLNMESPDQLDRALSKRFRPTKPA
jgi:eukaryotic-like serine/threonine-protein kinase